MNSDDQNLRLYLSQRPILVDYATRIVGCRGHAEDLVQEAYLRFDAAGREQTLADPVAYLHRIVRNLALDVRRRLNRERVRVAPDGEARLPQVASNAPTPEAAIATRRDVELISAAMDEMPERMRMALEMHRFGGMTFKQIAARLDISVGLAHALVVQAVEICRERLRSG